MSSEKLLPFRFGLNPLSDILQCSDMNKWRHNITCDFMKGRVADDPRKKPKRGNINSLNTNEILKYVIYDAVRYKY